MKVTVCFGSVRVVVPCGTDGDLTVRTLIEEAISRYKKAANKPANYSVTVHSLRSSVDNAILDDADFVHEVAEDREQLVAEFDEQVRPTLNGDDTQQTTPTALVNMLSYSVVSQYNSINNSNNNNNNNNNEKMATNLILTPESRTPVGGKSMNTVVFNGPSSVKQNGVSSSSVARSVLPVDDLRIPSNHDSEVTNYADAVPSPTASEASAYSGNPSPTGDSFKSSFVRDASRKSLGNGLSMGRWFDAQEKVGEQFEGRLSSNSSDTLSPSYVCSESSPSYDDVSSLSKSDGLLSSKLRYELPDGYSTSPRPPPRTNRQHSRHASDSSRVIELRNELAIQRMHSQVRANPSAPSSTNDGKSTTSVATLTKTVVPELPEDSAQKSAGKTATLPVGMSPSKAGVLAPTNTRLIGNKLSIDLVKGPQGLGFSVTSRDNLSGGSCPIYIKNILPSGAAIEDGRLRPGDRLLEVNGIKMTGKSQSEAVAVLRGVPANSTANLVISRQVVDDPDDIVPIPAGIAAAAAAPETPRSVTPSKSTQASVVPPTTDAIPQRSSSSVAPAVTPVSLVRDRTILPAPVVDNGNSHERLTFHVALGEAGFASLGISVTKISKNHRDLGIYIKSVMVGGTAAKDGRLRINDQLVEVNGISLMGLDNAHAIKVLRDAMQREGRVHGFIGITVVRRRASPTAASSHSTGGPREVRVSQAANDDIDGIFGVRTSRRESQRIDEATAVAVIGRPSAAAAAAVVPATCNDDTPTSIRRISLQKALSNGDPLFSHRREPSLTESTTTDNDSDSLVLSETLKFDDDFVFDEMSPDDSDQTPAFSREGFGRQSVSEKRKGHMDAKNLDVYQKIKSNKDQTPTSYASWDPRKSPLHKSAAEMLCDAHKSSRLSKVISRRLSAESSATPSQSSYCNSYTFTPAKIQHRNLVREIALKKCRSLEELQQQQAQQQQPLPASPSAETQLSESVDLTPARTKPTAISKPARSCIINESFRAAVDHSYDTPDARDVMDTVEEDSLENESSPSSGVSSVYSNPRLAVDEGRGWNVWKGITGFFRFGRQKKSEDLRKDGDPTVQVYRSSSSSGADVVRMISGNTKFYDEPHAAQQDRVANGTVVNNSRFYDTRQSQSRSERHGAPDCTPCGATQSAGDSAPVIKSKMDHIQELRRQYQQNHRERHGRYPHDDQQERFELQLREFEQRQQHSDRPTHSHLRTQSNPAVRPADRLYQSDARQHVNSSQQQRSVNSTPYNDSQFYPVPSSPYSKDSNCSVLSPSRVAPLPPAISRSNDKNFFVPNSPSSFGNSVKFWDGDVNSRNGVAPSTTAHGRTVNLPARHHVTHIPLTATYSPEYAGFTPGSPTRRSHRDPPTEPQPSGTFQRFVSLPNRQRRYYPSNMTAARSAQV